MRPTTRSLTISVVLLALTGIAIFWWQGRITASEADKEAGSAPAKHAPSGNFPSRIHRAVPPQNTSLAGAIQDSAGSPIAYARVCVQPEASRLSAEEAATDEVGQYSFSELLSEQYLVSASHEDYLPTYYSYPRSLVLNTPDPRL